MLTYLVLSLLVANFALAEDDCIDWFQRSKAKPGSPDCDMRCALNPTDMATFTCPSRCDDLCKPSSGSPKLQALVFYPGLTDEERSLVSINPKEALVVFKQKNRAEAATDKYFPGGRFNDESDAFRHFVWAGLLVKELGAERAQLYLDAHEKNPSQPPNERAMDLANNRGGILAAQKLLKLGQLNQTEIEKVGLEALRKKELVVLSPGLSIPKGVN